MKVFFGNNLVFLYPFAYFNVYFKPSLTLTFIDGVDPVDEPWQHTQAGHDQDEERRNSRSSYGAQVPCSEEDLVVLLSLVICYSDLGPLT